MLGDGVIFSRQVKQCLSEKVAFDNRAEGSEGGSSARYPRTFQGEETSTEPAASPREQQGSQAAQI